MTGQAPPDDAARVDADVAAGLARRDPAALAEVYDRYGARCFGVALRVLTDRALAEDVVQDVFLTVWRGGATFDPARGRLSSWLLTITHHKAVDLVRREQNIRRRRSPVELLQTEPAGDRAVDDQVAATLGGERVRAALEELPPAQREPVVLAYFGGYTQREIAELMGIPLGTVKTRTMTAMQRLRGVLAPRPVSEGEE